MKPPKPDETTDPLPLVLLSSLLSSRSPVHPLFPNFGSSIYVNCAESPQLQTPLNPTSPHTTAKKANNHPSPFHRKVCRKTLRLQRQHFCQPTSTRYMSVPRSIARCDYYSKINDTIQTRRYHVHSECRPHASNLQIDMVLL